MKFSEFIRENSDYYFYDPEKKYSDEFLRKVKKRDEDSAKARELTPEQEADWKEKTSGMRDNLRDVARSKMENKATNRPTLGRARQLVNLIHPSNPGYEYAHKVISEFEHLGDKLTEFPEGHEHGSHSQKSDIKSMSDLISRIHSTLIAGRTPENRRREQDYMYSQLDRTKQPGLSVMLPHEGHPGMPFHVNSYEPSGNIISESMDHDEEQWNKKIKEGYPAIHYEKLLDQTSKLHGIAAAHLENINDLGVKTGNPFRPVQHFDPDAHEQQQHLHGVLIKISNSHDAILDAAERAGHLESLVQHMPEEDIERRYDIYGWKGGKHWDEGWLPTRTNIPEQERNARLKEAVESYKRMKLESSQRAENPVSEVSAISEGQTSGFKFKEDRNKILSEEFMTIKNKMMNLVEASAMGVTKSEKRKRSKKTKTKKASSKKSVSKVKKGGSAEAHFVRRMGGKHSGKQPGSTAPDIIFSHPEHGRHVGEIKSGSTITLRQQSFKVEEDGKLKRSTKKLEGERAGTFSDRVSRRIHREHGPLLSGQTEVSRVSRKTGEVKTEKRAAAIEQLKNLSRRISVNFKNLHSFMSPEEAVHIHTHPTTGETVIVPNQEKHHHLGEKMGLKKTVSLWSLSKDQGKEKSGFKLRGFRSKGGSANASIDGSSAALVNAVKKSGGDVFPSADAAADHLLSYGWSGTSGQKT